MGQAGLPCFVLFVLLVTAANTLAVKPGTCIDLNRPPCQSSCPVSLPALSAFLPCQPSCPVSLPALSTHLPFQPSYLARLPALLWSGSMSPLAALSFKWIF